MFKLKTWFMQYLCCHHTTLLQHGYVAPTRGLKWYTNGNNVFSSFKLFSYVVQWSSLSKQWAARHKHRSIVSHLFNYVHLSKVPITTKPVYIILCLHYFWWAETPSLTGIYFTWHFSGPNWSQTMGTPCTNNKYIISLSNIMQGFSYRNPYWLFSQPTVFDNRHQFCIFATEEV